MRAKESSDPPLSLCLLYLFPLSLTSCRTPLSQRLESLPLGNASLILTQDGTKITLAAQAKYKVLSTICYEVKYFSLLV